MGLSESKAASARGATPPNENQQKVEVEVPREREYVHKEPVGVVVIGLGQRMCTLLRFLLLKHGRLVQIRAFCDDSPQAIQQGLEHLKYVRSGHHLSIYLSIHQKQILFSLRCGAGWSRTWTTARRCRPSPRTKNSSPQGSTSRGCSSALRTICTRCVVVPHLAPPLAVLLFSH